MVSALLITTACENGGRLDPRPIEDSTHPAIAYELQITRSMGWNELSDSTGPLNGDDRKASAGVLATPLTAVVDSQGRTYVLDGMFHKIAVFGPSGEYERVILGGYGRGPGEFVRAKHMAIAGDMLFVLDEGNLRVSVFNTDGTHTSSFNFHQPGPTYIAATRDRVFINYRRIAPSFVAVKVYDLAGAVVDSTVQMDGQVAHLASHGGGGAFGSRPDGTLVFALPTPSAWVELDRSGDIQGHNYFPEAMGYMRTLPAGMEVNAVPVRAIAITGLRDGSTLVYYLVREGGAAHGTVTDNGFIDVYAPDGKYRGSAALGDSVVYNSMHAVNGGPELVFTTMTTGVPEARHGRLIPLRVMGTR